MLKVVCFLPLVAGVASGASGLSGSLAQDLPPASAPVQAIASAAPIMAPSFVPPAANPSRVIPALTPLRVRFEVELGSKTSTTGDMFPITLAEPIMVNGQELVPAGATGQGEVIHAKKAGGSGSSGELVLAARYLDVGGRKLRLRSLQANAGGHDALHGALFASLVVPLGFLVTGTQTTYPKGWTAPAKTAETFILDDIPAGTSDPGPPVQQGGMTDAN